jgi:hypothetical protein
MQADVYPLYLANRAGQPDTDLEVTHELTSPRCRVGPTVTRGRPCELPLSRHPAGTVPS